MLSDLRLGPRVEKESIMVRWAGKKRDRVDEILVRELQVICCRGFNKIKGTSTVFWKN